MANIKSSLKDVERSEKRNSRNRSAKARMRTFCKKVLIAVDAKDLPAAQEALRQATSVLAVTAQKGIIHDNAAARHTERLNAKVKGLALALAS
ncbi:30S ribosomal protein S20 [Candidatus Magnetaquicoccus inordinatus]|uniref:30S ribosomal protein S20 n=1 Tax=Candidatus Magnetaquicoccus inordinatus TaxID=2496818 RepID=UPI00102B0A26|nr:30S ribosomal protein S20 [Candidatus Magnetaquicoccus inordinatus]